jgi:hypothetical protein
MDAPAFGDAPQAFGAMPDTGPGDDALNDDDQGDGSSPLPSFSPMTDQPPLQWTNGYVTAVPEPGTWTMLIAGFFAVGAAMRRRAREKTRPSEGTGHQCL